MSTWRSGSTFLGQLLQTHPGVFQHYEPLSYIGVKQVRSGKDAFLAQQVIHRLLDCQYEKLPDYMNYTKTHLLEMMGQNVPIWNACKNGPNKMVCADQTFLSESCQMFPIQLVKTVRLRLNLTQLLLNDDKLRVKVLFLVRDPRGIMSSRYSSVDWCSKETECGSPEVLCQDMQGDLKVASVFEKLYPERFMKLSYEELAGNTVEEVTKLLSFLGLEFTSSIKDYLNEHTSTNKDAPWSTARKSSERITLWKKNLSKEQIQEIQNACGKILQDLKLELI
ncbi:Carbohydrate sulfotransferase 1 [Armadillidium vulgare]|nr:Carbohydrate sulfotransferase 1 [Armadillidium vulgare]